MIEFVDVLSLKRKFATLLSKLHTDSSIPLANISEKIVEDDFFDFMERQDTDAFMQLSYEAASRGLFGMESVFSEGVNPVIYWAGLQYMGLSLNCGIPLKQIALLCPLDEMCAHFDIYHEMADTELVREFLSNEARRSILKDLRTRKGYSARMLSELSGIPKATINHYEKANENLFKASFENISALADVLGVSCSLFAARSGFAPYARSLMENEQFRLVLEGRLRKIYGKPSMLVSYELPLVFVRSSANSALKRYVPDEVLRRAFCQAYAEFSRSLSPKLWF